MSTSAPTTPDAARRRHGHVAVPIDAASSTHLLPTFSSSPGTSNRTMTPERSSDSSPTRAMPHGPRRAPHGSLWSRRFPTVQVSGNATASAPRGPQIDDQAVARLGVPRAWAWIFNHAAVHGSLPTPETANVEADLQEKAFAYYMRVARVAARSPEALADLDLRAHALTLAERHRARPGAGLPSQDLAVVARRARGEMALLPHLDDFADAARMVQAVADGTTDHEDAARVLLYGPIIRDMLSTQAQVRVRGQQALLRLPQSPMSRATTQFEVGIASLFDLPIHLTKYAVRDGIVGRLVVRERARLAALSPEEAVRDHALRAPPETYRHRPSDRKMWQNVVDLVLLEKVMGRSLHELCANAAEPPAATRPRPAWQRPSRFDAHVAAPIPRVMLDGSDDSQPSAAATPVMSGPPVTEPFEGALARVGADHPPPRFEEPSGSDAKRLRRDPTPPPGVKTPVAPFTSSGRGEPADWSALRTDGPPSPRLDLRTPPPLDAPRLDRGGSPGSPWWGADGPP